MLAWPLSCLVHVFLPVDIERKLLICFKNKKQTSKLSIRIKNLQKLNSETKKKEKSIYWILESSTLKLSKVITHVTLPVIYMWELEGRIILLNCLSL